MNSRTSVLEAKGIYKHFGAGPHRVEVLCGIDLTVGKGDTIAVVGASGVGKSTLLHILGTLERPSSGQVFYGGVDVFALGEEQLGHFRNRTIGFVFQFHHLLSEFTALENVMLPALIAREPRRQAAARAGEVLEAVGLGHRLHHRAGELSGGEQQRVAVARALVLRPRILLADEPTGNLDSKTGAAIHELLLALNQQYGVSMLVATHNMELAQMLGRRLRLRNGALEEL